MCGRDGQKRGHSRSRACNLHRDGGSPASRSDSRTACRQTYGVWSIDGESQGSLRDWTQGQ